MRTWAVVICALLVTVPLGLSASPEAPPGVDRNSSARLPMVATAYCDRGPTKSGVLAQPGIVAADPRHLPLGTKLHVDTPGQPYAGNYTVLDTGSKIKGRKLDIFMWSCAKAKRFGIRLVKVRILK